MWAIAILLAVIATVIVASFLGISVQFLTWSLGWAALSDDATAKYLVLFGWTFGAPLLGAVTKTVCPRSKPKPSSAQNHRIPKPCVHCRVAGRRSGVWDNLRNGGANAGGDGTAMIDLMRQPP